MHVERNTMNADLLFEHEDTETKQFPATFYTSGTNAEFKLCLHKEFCAIYKFTTTNASNKRL